MGGFRVFCRRYLRKHFHTLAVNRTNLATAGLSPEVPSSLVVYANHASWWDPLIAMFLAERLFPDHALYAPIDAEAFEKYRMFGKMGFYPVNQHTVSGAKNFLQISRRVLSRPQTSIWLTPEGKFSDPRNHRHELMPGLAHLAASIQRNISNSAGDSSQQAAIDHNSDPSKGVTQGKNQASEEGRGEHRIWFIPAAVEYSFWEEKLPEVLVWFGSPLSVDRSADAQDAMAQAAAEAVPSKSQWHERLTVGLRDAQTALAEAVINRKAELFEVLLSSQSGTFFIYDWWRQLRSGVSGKRFNPGHGEHFQNES